MRHEEGRSGETGLGRPVGKLEVGQKIHEEAPQIEESSHIREFLNIPCMIFSRVVTRKVSG